MLDTILLRRDACELRFFHSRSVVDNPFLAHLESLPRLSDDFYSLFDLVDLAAEVARERPNGEKNALRKTYKGHIKRLGVAGHFDVQKKPEDVPSEFLSMVLAPDLEWNVHEVKGKEVADGLSEMTLSSLGRAMTMAKGPISKQIWDASVLGELAPSTAEGKQSSSKPVAPGTPSASTPSNMPRKQSQIPYNQDPTRPKRNVRKRGYGDSSFEGYGEGFPDDDAGADTGYDTGEGDGGQKRRKKVSGDSNLGHIEGMLKMSKNPGNSSPYPSSMRQQAYGPGMVGA